MTGVTAGQAALQPVESVYLYHWRFDRGEEFGLYRHREDADAVAATRAGEGLAEVIGIALLDRPQPEPAPASASQARRLTEQQPAPAVTVDTLAAALDGRLFLAETVPGTSLAKPRRPRDLAVHLLSAIDMRLTDDVPPAAPEPTEAAERAASTEMAAIIVERNHLRDLVAEILDSYEACDDRGPVTRTQLAKWRKRALDAR